MSWEELHEGTIVAAVEWPCSVDPWADRRSCPWLQDHGRWKAAMKLAAKVLHEVICNFVLSRYCMVCKREFLTGYGRHLLEVPHWERLRRQVPEGRHVVAASMTIWQSWQLPQGLMLRFNHLHGQVEIIRDLPTRPKQVMRREVLPNSPRRSSLQSSSALRRSTSLTMFTGLPAPSSLERGDAFKEHMRGRSRRHQVDWEIYPYLEPQTEPDELQIEHFAWRLWLEYVATEDVLMDVHRAFQPTRCSVCDFTLPSSRSAATSFAQHLCSRQHFSALCDAVISQEPKITTHPTQTFKSSSDKILELDHLQLSLRIIGTSTSWAEEPPLMRGVTELEEFAWRLWRQYVATGKATEAVQKQLIQYEIFQESLVCAVCREALPNPGAMGQHFRSPQHFRKLLWWLFQAKLLSGADLFRPNSRLMRQSFRGFDWCLKLDHLQFCTRVTGTSSKAGGPVFQIAG